MRKLLLLSLNLVFICLVSKATIHVVEVANFQFSPANISNVFVGDVVRFVWVSGFHTTTNDPASNGAGNELPAGAATWDAALTGPNTSFDYTVTVAGTYKYWCTPHSPDMSGSFTASASLPVKLSSFLLTGSNDKVTLNWKTMTEENVDYFSIRRSANGSVFTEIARVPATGTTVRENKYSFADTKINQKQKYYYYYIAAVDKDGKQTMSPTKLFKNNLIAPKLILSLSPNPITGAGHLMMSFNAEKRGKMDVKVINTEGKTMLNTMMQAVEGVNNGHVHLGNLPSGTYSIICTMNGVKETHKIVFNK